MTTPLDTLAAAVATVDRCDWRIAQEPDTGEWVAWFHPDWQADPVRVVLADEEPSPNEVAAITALQLVMEHAPALLRLARAVAEERDAALAMGAHSPNTPAWADALDRYARAVLATPAALAALTTTTSEETP